MGDEPLKSSTFDGAESFLHLLYLSFVSLSHFLSHSLPFLILFSLLSLFFCLILSLFFVFFISFYGKFVHAFWFNWWYSCKAAPVDGYTLFTLLAFYFILFFSRYCCAKFILLDGNINFFPYLSFSRFLLCFYGKFVHAFWCNWWYPAKPRLWMVTLTLPFWLFISFSLSRVFATPNSCKVMPVDGNIHFSFSLSFFCLSFSRFLLCFYGQFIHAFFCNW